MFGLQAPRSQGRLKRTFWKIREVPTNLGITINRFLSRRSLILVCWATPLTMIIRRSSFEKKKKKSTKIALKPEKNLSPSKTWTLTNPNFTDSLPQHAPQMSAAVEFWKIKQLEIRAKDQQRPHHKGILLKYPIPISLIDRIVSLMTDY